MYLTEQIRKHNCVFNPEDVHIDTYGNLVWTVEDKEDATPNKRVIMFDGHTDTVAPLNEDWLRISDGGCSAFDGLLDGSKMKEEILAANLGWFPQPDEFSDCIWGRGSADQLAGVISQMIATKIMIELKDEGALKGVIIRSVGTAAEEDNDGAGPMYIFKHEVPGAAPEVVPDVVIFTEGTGDSNRSALGIYRGQRGRMQIEVEVVGASCHGSNPTAGLNPLEYGARIIVEATEQIKRGEGILDNAFLGKGTRTASWCKLDTPSYCAVPQKFTFRFDRRMTVGETPEQCVADIAGLPAIEVARKAGLTVTVRVPHYNNATWVGYYPDNDETYLGWETPEDHAAIRTATSVYSSVISPNLTEKDKSIMHGLIKEEPCVSRWIFSTDGVGVAAACQQHAEGAVKCEGKQWITSPAGFKHPAMLGLGAGMEQNTHSLFEVIHSRELKHACAWMARYPSRYFEVSQE
eukprot:gnl/Ergobibamus_cyprinoides/2035.p2 GENE.gnl/Ergobibamus_cyprinoides/2035~~gnl/Ergobibamus_cyprinoides/2035.p2  ORF type:complete len:516 (+),score=264.44 gnl/Ergobibamus_cyprinoides/2035:162-1550(+)